MLVDHEEEKFYTIIREPVWVIIGSARVFLFFFLLLTEHSKVSRRREFRFFARENTIYAIYDNYSRLGREVFVRSKRNERDKYIFVRIASREEFFPSLVSNPNYFIRTQRSERAISDNFRHVIK